METRTDVIVVGAGHAGIEAALAAARLGAAVCLVTLDLDATGRMPCNPAIGGLAKGVVVREVDALGGAMGVLADGAALQFRMLNRSRGPAVRGPRAQEDRAAYAAAARAALEAAGTLTLRRGEVRDLVIEGGAARGVLLADGAVVRARAVVLTTGTFLRGLVHVGPERTPGGRAGEPPADALSASLVRAGCTLSRFKTGTPPRVRRGSVALETLERQDGDADPVPFSFLTPSLTGLVQVPCHVTWTHPGVHALIRANLDRAPLYTGQIASTGPRYCPSLETKVVRFPDRERHQVFLEPEGRHTESLYLNGVSTSLPRDLQDAVVRSLPGLENAEILNYGYAIEYDIVPPLGQLRPDLQSARLEGLFLAGQINGTSGYEEAAGQGILAGCNAARVARGDGTVALRRDQAYIGVMVDDLVTRGVTEPYRLFTSRAEHRLVLRPDNADRRLTRLGHALGLAPAARLKALERHEAAVAEALAFLASARRGTRTLLEILRRPEVDYPSLAREEAGLAGLRLDARAAEQVEIDVKYAGYVERIRAERERAAALDDHPIPAELDYFDLAGLRFESRERLAAVRPRTLGQAGRVEGVTPADVSVLAVHLKRLRGRGEPRGVENR